VGNYAVGASFMVNVNRWISLEAESGESIGIPQTLKFNQTPFTDQRTKHVGVQGERSSIRVAATES
jgi:hypothetical protein